MLSFHSPHYYQVSHVIVTLSVLVCLVPLIKLASVAFFPFTMLLRKLVNRDSYTTACVGLSYSSHQVGLVAFSPFTMLLRKLVSHVIGDNGFLQLYVLYIWPEEMWENPSLTISHVLPYSIMSFHLVYVVYTRYELPYQCGVEHLPHFFLLIPFLLLFWYSNNMNRPFDALQQHEQSHFDTLKFKVNKIFLF